MNILKKIVGAGTGTVLKVSRTKITLIVAAVLPFATKLLAGWGVEIPDELVKSTLTGLFALAGWFLRDSL